MISYETSYVQTFGPLSCPHNSFIDLHVIGLVRDSLIRINPRFIVRPVIAYTYTCVLKPSPHLLITVYMSLISIFSFNRRFYIIGNQSVSSAHLMLIQYIEIWVRALCEFRSFSADGFYSLFYFSY